MRTIKLICLLLLVASVAYGRSIPFLNSSVEIIDSTEAAAVIGIDDGYPAGFSLFDIQSRLGNAATYKDYLPFAMHQTQNWSATEQEALKDAFSKIATFLTAQSINLNLPAKIYLIKSTTKEEFGAEGYTRANKIVLNTSVEGISTGLVAHELFHVFSRHNPNKRDQLYRIFGFKKCNPIALKEAIENRNITNPDCPLVSHYLTIDNEDMTLLLYSNRNYTGGSVFEKYVSVGLLVLEGRGDDMKPKKAGGKAVIKEIKDTPALFNLIGTNTGYVLHPEEICADHFSMMITGKKVEQPELIEKFKSTLQAKD